jgi:hypothetical protein
MMRLRLSRFVHKHSRFAVAWAMLPLDFLNGQTITGCGCNGRFEAVCRCHCGSSCGHCCGQAGVHGCCANKVANVRASDSAAPQRNSEQVRGRHCTEVAEYVVLPATVAATLAGNDTHAAALALVALDLPLGTVSAHSWRVFQLDTGPPNDLVVVLHRLVI